MIFIFLGPPGSGKGTQASIISKEYNIKAFSTGDILRNKAKEDSPSGKKLAADMVAGKLVETSVVNEIVVEALSSGDKSLILDGYPRNLEQARFLEERGVALSIIFFKIDDEILVKRLEGRFSCAACGQLYNKYFTPPKIEDICDHCNSQHFSYRSDDKREVILERLREYKSETSALIKYYEDKGALNVIDASIAVSDISKQVTAVVKNALTL